MIIVGSGVAGAIDRQGQGFLTMANAFFTTNGIPRAVTSIRRDANGQPQSLDASLPPRRRYHRCSRRG